MKSLLVAAALFATASLSAYTPSCFWNDCIGSWDGTNCNAGNGWSCLCNNATAIAQINTCVATSCTNTTDQEVIYGAIAQICANNGVTVTASQQATFSATSGGSILATITPGPGYPGWGTGAWSSWVSACSTALPGAPGGWNGGPWGSHSGWGGPGGWGPNSNGGGGWGGRGGPWGTKASGVNCDAWTTWTAGWGPFSSWTGTWSGCSATTATPVPATVTTTLTGGGSTQVVTGTTFGVQAVEAAAATTAASSGSSSSSSGGNSGAVSINGGLHAYAALAAAIFAAMVVL